MGQPNSTEVGQGSAPCATAVAPSTTPGIWVSDYMPPPRVENKLAATQTALATRAAAECPRPQPAVVLDPLFSRRACLVRHPPRLTDLRIFDGVVGTAWAIQVSEPHREHGTTVLERCATRSLRRMWREVKSRLHLHRDIHRLCETMANGYTTRGFSPFLAKQPSVPDTAAPELRPRC